MQGGGVKSAWYTLYAHVLNLNIIYAIHVHNVTTLVGVVVSSNGVICHTFTQYVCAIRMPSAHTTQPHHSLTLAT